jgi:hypothetical protein
MSATRSDRNRRYGYLPPPLARLPERRGSRPEIAPRHPSPQLDQKAPAGVRARLLELAATLDGVAVGPPREEGDPLALAPALAMGQPEAFLSDSEFAIVRDDGSLHLALAPGWGQKVVDRGWATILPLARYMAGAVGPGRLVVYAPRDERDLRTVWGIVQAAHLFAVGRVGVTPLPDSRW